MSVDSLVCVHTKEEGSTVRFPEFKRSRIDEVYSATDDVGDDAPSRYKLAIRRKPKQEHWWDFGMVFSSISTEEVTVDLMNIEECLIDRRVATLHESMGIGMSFALVDLKLYGFGNFPKMESEPESVDFFVCDLNDKSYPYEFCKAGQLNGPKICPIVIPFPETKQILIIATGRFRCGDGQDLPVKVPYCELLDLPSEDNGGLYQCKAISTPWDDTYGTVYGGTPNSKAHAVVGNLLYIQIIAGEWNFEQRLFCFDMKTHKWSEVEARAQCPFLQPLDGFWRSLNDISRDKLFVAHVDRSDSELTLFIGVTSLADLSKKTCHGKLDHREHLKRIVTALPTLEKLLTDK